MPRTPQLSAPSHRAPAPCDNGDAASPGVSHCSPAARAETVSPQFSVGSGNTELMEQGTSPTYSTVTALSAALGLCSQPWRSETQQENCRGRMAGASQGKPLPGSTSCSAIPEQATQTGPLKPEHPLGAKPWCNGVCTWARPCSKQPKPLTGFGTGLGGLWRVQQCGCMAVVFMHGDLHTEPCYSHVSLLNGPVRARVPIAAGAERDPSPVMSACRALKSSRKEGCSEPTTSQSNSRAITWAGASFGCLGTSISTTPWDSEGLCTLICISSMGSPHMYVDMQLFHPPYAK